MDKAQLKRVSVNDLQLGMHLHAMDGPWLEHPFWRSRFTLTDPADIDALRRSSIAYCWIDVRKGTAPAAATAADAPAAPATSTAPTEENFITAALAADAAQAPMAAQAVAQPPLRKSTARPTRLSAPRAVPIGEEMERAATLVAHSRSAVQALFREARLGKSINAEGCQSLVDDIASSVLRNPSALISLARLKTLDDYSYMHSVAVCAMMVALAREHGFDMNVCRQAGLAGLLHDVGKAVMPLDVLNKPGKLNDEEWVIMRSHPERGHAILLEARGAGEAALEVCLHHHERMDGSGYPHRLAGEQVTLLSRMGAVCDVYDAITSNRAYKAGWDPAHALAQMASWKGHFDPGVFSRFVKSLGIYPVGSLVRLESGRLAVVIEHNPEAVLAPRVRVFFSTKSKMPIPTETVDLARTGCRDRIVGRESRETWGFDHLEELWGADS